MFQVTWPRWSSCPYIVKHLKTFFSRTRSHMIWKLDMYHWGLKLYKTYINDDNGLTLTYFTARSNWVAFTLDWEKSLKFFFSRTRCPMILKLGMQHQRLKLYKVYINDDTGLTLTYITGRSDLVTYTFEWGKLLQSHFSEKNICSKWLNWLTKCVNDKILLPRDCFTCPGL